MDTLVEMILFVGFLYFVLPPLLYLLLFVWTILTHRDDDHRG